jgi:hypothetical protein
MNIKLLQLLGFRLFELRDRRGVISQGICAIGERPSGFIFKNISWLKFNQQTINVDCTIPDLETPEGFLLILKVLAKKGYCLLFSIDRKTDIWRVELQDRQGFFISAQTGKDPISTLLECIQNLNAVEEI